MRVQLLRAWPHRRETVEVEVNDGACVGDALAVAGWRMDDEFTALAIFGQGADMQTRLHIDDRIELLRALQIDPKQARRRRAEKSGHRRG